MAADDIWLQASIDKTVRDILAIRGMGTSEATKDRRAKLIVIQGGKQCLQSLRRTDRK